MISDDQFAQWLARDEPTRVIVALIYHMVDSGSGPAQVVEYVCSRPYSDPDIGDVNDAILATPDFTRSLEGERLTNYSSNIGNFDLDNADGLLDELSTMYCDGSEVRFFVGDESWAFSDFRFMFSSVIVKPENPELKRLQLKLKDAGEFLNKSVGGSVKIGGIGPNADRWRQVNVGYCRQVEAILIDEASLTYSFNDTGDGVFPGGIEQIVRDNGAPIDYVNLFNGTFQPVVNPFGQLTTNVLVAPSGDEAKRLFSDVIQEIVGVRAGFMDDSRYIGPGPNFEVSGDEDYPIGISITEKRNTIDLLTVLCDSGLTFWGITRFGQFFFDRLRPSYIEGLPTGSVALITTDDIRDDSFQRDTMDPKYGQLQATMSKNWTIISTTAESLTPDEKAELTRPGLYRIQGASIGTSYADAPELYHKTLVQSSSIETMLSGVDDETDALILDQWMETRRAMFLPWVHQVRISVDLTYYALELGDVVTLQHNRYGYDEGVLFQVIGITIRLVDNRIDLTLIRRHVQAPYAGRITAPVEEPQQEDLDVSALSGSIDDPPPVGIPPLPGLTGDGFMYLPGPLFPGSSSGGGPTCVERLGERFIRDTALDTLMFPANWVWVPGDNQFWLTNTIVPSTSGGGTTQTLYRITAPASETAEWPTNQTSISKGIGALAYDSGNACVWNRTPYAGSDYVQKIDTDGILVFEHTATESEPHANIVPTTTENVFGWDSYTNDFGGGETFEDVVEVGSVDPTNGIYTMHWQQTSIDSGTAGGAGFGFPNTILQAYEHCEMDGKLYFALLDNDTTGGVFRWSVKSVEYGGWSLNDEGYSSTSDAPARLVAGVTSLWMMLNTDRTNVYELDAGGYVAHPCPLPDLTDIFYDRARGWLWLVSATRLMAVSTPDMTVLHDTDPLGATAHAPTQGYTTAFVPHYTNNVVYLTTNGSFPNQRRAANYKFCP